MTGNTKNSGWQFGLRKTFKISTEKLWDFITSDSVAKIIVGEVINFDDISVRDHVSSKNIKYRITTVVPQSHIRMRWQSLELEQYSILQIRVIERGTYKSTLVLHQEKLKDEQMRDAMKIHWGKVFKNITKLLEDK